jgi:hypothetical protein
MHVLVENAITFNQRGSLVFEVALELRQVVERVLLEETRRLGLAEEEELVDFMEVWQKLRTGRCLLIRAPFAPPLAADVESSCPSPFPLASNAAHPTSHEAQ